MLGAPIIRRVRQKRGFCGPASIEMMLSFYGINHSQDEIANRAEVIEGEAGSRIDQLNQAVQSLRPDYTLLSKYNSTIEDIILLLYLYGIPVGVEWQGIFIDDEGKQFEVGHYSVINWVDKTTGSIHIIDPDERSALEDGWILYDDFIQRWWDENDVPLIDNPKETEVICNEGLIFVLVPQNIAVKLMEFGLQPVSLDLMRNHHNQYLKENVVNK